MPYETTRIYLSSDAAAVSPAFNASGTGGTWNNTAQAIRAECSKTKGSSALTEHGLTGMSTSGTSYLAVQFVSEALGLEAPSILISGLVRAKTNEHSVTPPLRYTYLRSHVYFVSSDGTTARTPSGGVNDYSSPPPIYWSGSYVDSLALQAEASSRPTPSIVDGVPQWPGYPYATQFLSFPDVIATDRLVIGVGFSASLGSNRAPSLEYGEDIANALALDDVDADGYGFFDLYTFTARFVDSTDQITYTRPRARTNRPSTIVAPVTAPVLPLNGGAFNEP